VAEEIRNWIVDSGLKAGDRIPDIDDFARRLGMSRGTVRAGIAMLEAQGFLDPGNRMSGGWILGSISGERVEGLIADSLVVSGLPLSDIYRIRRLLEPDLVAELAGQLSGDTLEELEAVIDCDMTPVSLGPVLDRQIAALAFQARLAREASNPLLGLLVGCCARALSEMAASDASVAPPEAAFVRKGRDYRRVLLAALRDGDARQARRVMLDHLETVLHLTDAEAARTRPRLIAE
jgi:DNA-binding FadR family transcriptional regulator